MKPDERELLAYLVRKRREGVVPRDALKGYPIATKRAWYLLEKWCDKGWYDYGCSLDLGWFNDDKLPPSIA